MYHNPPIVDIGIFFLAVIPLAIVFFNAYKWANREDKEMQVINTIIAHNGQEERIYVGSICDPQPFDWESALHMMLPNELAAYIKEDK